MIQKTVFITYPWNVVEQQTLTQLLRKSAYTVLYFYPKDNTPWCTLEAQDFTRLQQDFKKYDCQIIWISKDPEKSHHKFIDSCGLSIWLITDNDLELHHEFNTVWEKSMFGKKYMWTIRSTFIVNSQWDILKEYRNISATWHAHQVLTDFSTLL